MWAAASNLGYGIEMAGGGQTAAISGITAAHFSKTGGVVTVVTGNAFTTGQVVNIFHSNSTDQTNFDGNFLVTSASGLQFTYDYAGPNVASANSVGNATPKLSSSVDVAGIFNGLKKEVTIDAGAYNNTVLDMSSNLAISGGSHVTDGGQNDFIRLSSAASGNNPSNGFNTFNLNVGANTPASTDVVAIADALNNTGNGHLLSVQTATGSSAKPVAFGNNNNGVEMSTAGTLAAVGSGQINAGVLVFFCNGLFPSSATSTLVPGIVGSGVGCAVSATTPLEIPLPFGGSLKNLTVTVTAHGNGSTDGVVTVFKNGSGTGGLTCTVGGTNTFCQSIAGTSQMVSANDTISVRVTTVASTTLKDMRASVQLQ